MLTIGRHLIAEFYGCDRELIDDVAQVRSAILDAAHVIGATVVGETFHKFAPQGVSGTVVIAESHLSVHTWPERGYVAVDIYTCGGLDPRRATDGLRASLRASGCRVQEILRGLPEDLEEHRDLLPNDVQVVTRWSDEF
ncbi:MAG: adenosylmethionine decarboxylase [Planctomycetes bacterium]|nr:adenosylmethionine decarboxylase [Planctomycetota bacterium]